MKNPPLRHLRLLPWCALLSIVLLLLRPASAADAPMSRITVAMLPFADETKDPDASHWKYSLPGMLSLPLKEIQAIRVYSLHAADYGMRKFQIRPGEKVDENQARGIGELIESRRVIWGSYRREGNKWTVTARVTATSTGKSSPPLSASSDDWQSLAYDLGGKILKELEIQPTPEEAEKMKFRVTSSPQALEHYSRCYSMYKENKPLKEVEKMALSAISLDPQFANAYYAHGASLMSQGKYAEAKTQFEKARDIRPGLSSAITGLAVILMLQSEVDEAVKLLRRAIQTDPDDEENYMRLGEYHVMSKEIPKAIEQFEIARQLNPVSAEVRAQLGRVYVRSGQREKSLQALQDAVMIDPENVNVHQATFHAYYDLGMKSRAIEHGEIFIKKAREIGLTPEGVKNYEEEVERLRASLKTHMLDAKQPRDYSREELHAALRNDLTQDEYVSLIYPYDSTPAMKEWALRHTSAADSPLEKARALFDAMTARLDPGPGGTLTAMQVFERWDQPNISFRCQEYARFFVALARDLGLRSYYVYVKKDHDGDQVIHACAALFLDGKLIFVDPSYRWFGIPHQEYEIMDDLEAVAHLMNQTPVVAHNRIAVKLQPRSALALYNLAGRLIRDNQREEALRYWEQLWAIDPDSWMTHSSRGLAAWIKKDKQQAEKELRLAADLCKYDSNIWFNLGNLLIELSQWKEAREAFRSCLRYKPDAPTEQQCRKAIAVITETLDQEEDYAKLDPEVRWRQKVMAQLQESFEVFQWKPTIYPHLGLVFDDRPEPLRLAAEAFKKTCKARPDDLLSHHQLSQHLRAIGDASEADAAWNDTQAAARRLLEKNPRDPRALRIMMLAANQTAEAEPYVKEIIQSSPQAWITWITLAEHQMRIVQRQIFAGMKNLPPTGFDMKRLGDLANTRKIPVKEGKALIAMCDKAFSHCTKAMELEPTALEPCIEAIGLRMNLLMLSQAIAVMSGEEPDSAAAQQEKMSAVIRTALARCQDQHRARAALSFLECYALMNQPSRKGEETQRQAMLQEKITTILLPIQDSLLAASREEAKLDAEAYEAYAAPLWGIRMMGFQSKIPANFTERLHRIVQQDPQRCLAWDALLSYEMSRGDLTNEEKKKRCFDLATARAKAIDSSRSRQFLAINHPDPRAALDLWNGLVQSEPRELSHQINAAIAQLRLDATEAGLLKIQTQLQEIGDRGYDLQYWENHADQNLNRLIAFATVQLLLGKIDVAERILDKILQMDPSDKTAHTLKQMIAEKP
jgi:tetratricopeptide (TPR) repeat protein/TolB-like protein